MVVLLHNIRSLHNVGSILRTSDAVGVEKLYLCGITPSPLDRFKEVRSDVAKVALGAEKTVPWEKVESTEELVLRLKSEGYTIVALEQSLNSVPYYTVRSEFATLERVALILGAEVDGVPASVLEKSDRIVEIPMSGSKESLNVAVAFGVIAFWLRDSQKANSKS